MNPLPWFYIMGRRNDRKRVIKSKCQSFCPGNCRKQLSCKCICWQLRNWNWVELAPLKLWRLEKTQKKTIKGMMCVQRPASTTRWFCTLPSKHTHHGMWEEMSTEPRCWSGKGMEKEQPRWTWRTISLQKSAGSRRFPTSFCIQFSNSIAIWILFSSQVPPIHLYNYSSTHLTRGIGFKVQSHLYVTLDK